MLVNCPICGSYNISYGGSGIICENKDCPGKKITITVSNNTKEYPICTPTQNNN